MLMEKIYDSYVSCCISHNDTANEYLEDVNKFFRAVSTIERNKKIDSQKSEILTCLHFYRNCQASQAHDKIFGLHSLVNLNGRSLIKPDYKRSVEDAYTNLCMEHINQIGSFEALKYVLWSAKNSQFEATLPSWVPDWTLDTPEPR